MSIINIENKLIFNSTFSSEELNNISEYADMFDEQIFKNSEILSKAQLNRTI